MKRNRTHALEFVLENRKRILKGFSALLRILEKLPGDISVAELLAAGKAGSKKTAPKKTGPRSAAKPTTKKRNPAAIDGAGEKPAEPSAPPSVDQTVVETVSM